LRWYTYWHVEDIKFSSQAAKLSVSCYQHGSLAGILTVIAAELLRVTISIALNHKPLPETVLSPVQLSVLKPSQQITKTADGGLGSWLARLGNLEHRRKTPLGIQVLWELAEIGIYE